MQVKTVYEAQNILGEGPVWSAEEQALYWVDIYGPTLQRLRIPTSEYRVWNMPDPIGCFALREQGGAIVGLGSGLAFLDLESGGVTPLIDPETDKPQNRFNDGKCDRSGRFWAGTMPSNGEPAGALYRYDPNGRITTMREQVYISNGLGWSPDNQTMYYTDTVTNTIFAYDFDANSGVITNMREFVKVSGKDGYPDGLTVDSDGYVWSAMWDGWRVVRYAPDGSIDREVAMPVQRPTSCMFGGPELKHLYVTSASIGIKGDDLAKQPLAGSVFVIETEVSGLPEPKFAG